MEIYYFFFLLLCFQTIEQQTRALAHHIDTKYEVATFGMGCFWGAESLFGGTYGVLRTKVGYSGGTTSEPVYRNMLAHS